MAEVTICRRCAGNRGIPVEAMPPVRVTRRPCDSCGGYDEVQGRKIDRNYVIAGMQLPGSSEDPNRKAEQEEAGRG